MDSAELSRADIEAYYSQVVPDMIGSGDERRARCVIHNGSSPTSLAIDLSTGRWYCHSKCGRGGDVFGLEMLRRNLSYPEAYKAVYELIGRTPPPFQGQASKPPLTPYREKLNTWRITATYVYQDETGKAIYRAVRKEKAAVGDAKPEKRFSLETPKDGGWSSAPGNMEGVRRIPYRLPELLQAKAAGNYIFLVEGEKAVESLIQLKLAATTNPQGAGKWPKYRHDLNPPFVGAKVLILPDNDDPGRKHALAVADNLLSLAAEIKIVELPDLPEKGDVVDWLAAGGTRNELIRLAKATPILDAALLQAFQRQWTVQPAKVKKSEEPMDLPWDTSTEIDPGPTPSDDEPEDDSLDPAAAKIHSALSRLLGSKFLRFVQIGTEEPRFRLETTKGIVRFENLGQIIAKREFNRLAGPVLDRCLSMSKDAHWADLGSMLLSVKVVEQPDPEATPTGSARAWLVDYLQANMRHASWEAALKADESDRKLPHFEGNRICVSADHIRNWCAKHRNEILTYNRLSEILTDICGKGNSVLKSIRKPKTNITFYRLPAEFEASDYQIDSTTATPAAAPQDVDAIDTNYIV